MTAGEVQIAKVTSDADIAAAAGVIGTAFASLQASEWLLPDQDIKDVASIMADVFAITVAHVVQHGVLYLATDPADGGRGEAVGAAAWLDQTWPDTGPPDYDNRLLAAAGAARDRFAHLDSLFEQHHPTVPHYHLAFLGVLPDHQDRGIGTALLHGHLAMLDEKRIPAYLDASNADSARLYKRHEFEPHSAEFALPNGATFIPMWRQPVSEFSTEL